MDFQPSTGYDFGQLRNLPFRCPAGCCVTPSEFDRLLAQARVGCRESMGLLLASCQNYLLAIAQASLHEGLTGKVAASSVVQETFLEAGRDLDCFRTGEFSEFQAWLRAILLNNLADARRRFESSKKRDISMEVVVPSSYLEELALARDPSPSSSACLAEQTHRLQAAMAQLPAEYRQVIELRNRDKLRFAEIGLRLSRTPDSARMMWIRAVEELQAILAGP